MGTADRFRRIIGWEKFGGEWFLRMALSRPRLATVWPGGQWTVKPEGEQWRLLDEVLPLADVRKIVSGHALTDHPGYSDRDMKLLQRALAGHPERTSAPTSPRPEFPPFVH